MGNINSIKEMLERDVAAGQMAGAATIVWRDNKLSEACAGWRDIEAKLPVQRRANSMMLGQRVFASGHGYGMGVAVVLEPEIADPLRCGGGIGAVGWPGAYGGWWQADPNDQSVLIFLAHNSVELRQLAKGIGLGIWDTISRFQALGSERPHS